MEATFVLYGGPSKLHLLCNASDRTVEHVQWEPYLDTGSKTTCDTRILYFMKTLKGHFYTTRCVISNYKPEIQLFPVPS